MFVDLDRKYSYEDGDTVKFSFNIGDTMFIFNEVVKIQGLKPILHTKLFNKNGISYRDTLIDSFMYFEPTNVHFFTYGIGLENRHKGNLIYKAIIKLVDSVTNDVIIVDSIKRNIHVE